MELVFKPKAKPKNTIKVEFPDGTAKEFEILPRTIDSQRKVIEVFKSFQKVKSDDADASFKALDRAINVLLCGGANLSDFSGFDTEDIIDLVNMIRDQVLAAEPRESAEKKTASKEAT